MPEKEIFEDPSEVDAEDGVVVVRGPASIHYLMTPQAAEATSERLLTGAMKARGQMYFSGKTPPD